jgi:hypothetical protein
MSHGIYNPDSRVVSWAIFMRVSEKNIRDRLFMKRDRLFTAFYVFIMRLILHYFPCIYYTDSWTVSYIWRTVLSTQDCTCPDGRLGGHDVKTCADTCQNIGFHTRGWRDVFHLFPILYWYNSSSTVHILCFLHYVCYRVYNQYESLIYLDLMVKNKEVCIERYFK